MKEIFATDSLMAEEFSSSLLVMSIVGSSRMDSDTVKEGWSS